MDVITVVVAVKNMAGTLAQCLDSILRQSYPHKELILMDGASSDGSLDIIASRHDAITYWESKEDQGIYDAWNKALTRCQGDWVCFIGADDFLWDDQVLEALAPELERAEKEGIGLAYGQMARISKEGDVLELRGKPWQSIRWQMAHGMPLHLPHPGLMHRRRLFEEHGLFDASFRIAGDYDFLLRELKHKNRSALYIPNIRTIGNRAGGIADTRNLLAHREVARARRQNGMKAVSPIWLLVYIRAMVRDMLRRRRLR